VARKPIESYPDHGDPLPETLQIIDAEVVELLNWTYHSELVGRLAGFSYDR